MFEERNYFLNFYKNFYFSIFNFRPPRRNWMANAKNNYFLFSVTIIYTNILFLLYNIVINILCKNMVYFYYEK